MNELSFFCRPGDVFSSNIHLLDPAIARFDQPLDGRVKGARRIAFGAVNDKVGDEAVGDEPQPIARAVTVTVIVTVIITVTAER